MACPSVLVGFVFCNVLSHMPLFSRSLYRPSVLIHEGIHRCNPVVLVGLTKKGRVRDCDVDDDDTTIESPRTIAGLEERRERMEAKIK